MHRLVVLTLALLASPTVLTHAPTSQVPRLQAVSAIQPTRVLDTRIGLGAPAGAVTPGKNVTLILPAAANAEASSIILNVTATEATANGWVKAWPCIDGVPDTSALNFTPGRTAANAVVVKLSAGGICLSTNVSVQLVADLQGWMIGTTDFTGIAPKRLLDTRITADPLLSNHERHLKVAGAGGVDATAKIAALNITVDRPGMAGYVVAYPCGQASNGSTVNFNAGEIVASLTMVALSPAGEVCIRSSVDQQLVVDVYGWSSGAGKVKVQSPSRLLDTRDVSNWAYGSAQTFNTIKLRVAGRGGVPNDADAALLTVTVANPKGDGFVTVWSCDQQRPTASTLNTWSDALRSNLTLVKLAASDGTACLYYQASNLTPTDLVVDAVGWTTGGPARPPATETGSVVLPGASGCVLSNVAFCDTFDEPQRNSATRSGDLDASVWGVSRTNTIVNFGQGQYNDWSSASLTGCGVAAITVTAPNDVRVCNGRVYEAVADNGGQSTLAMYPKQPFDVAGRTGTVVFDVSADSGGPHNAWPEFWWTDQPVPAPHGHLSAQAPFAQNSFGFSIADDNCGSNGTSVYEMMVTRNRVVESIPFTKTGCVTKGSATGGLNHFEVRIRQGGVEVWASDPGSTVVREIAVATVNMPLTRGVIWLEDVHYNACKDGFGIPQCNHTFAWDNVGFDGPTPYRDLTFDVQDASPTSLAYQVEAAATSVTAPGVYWLQTPTKVFVTMNWFPYEAAVPSVRVNGGAWHDTPWPFDAETFAWRTLAIPIDFADVRPGDNTIEFKFSGSSGTIVSNIDLILIAASPVP